MNLKKYIIIIILTVFLFSIAGVSASDTNETLMTSIDDSPVELSKNNEDVINQKSINGGTEDELLGAGEGTYEDLSVEIGNGGDKYLTKSYYKYTGGNTIEIHTPGVINGNGAVIDMAGSNIRAFYVTVSAVIINNITIKNANYGGSGGAIYFSTSGIVTNCNFTGNTATGGYCHGGAVYFRSTGTVTNCNFADNTASSDGGAVYFRTTGTVTNCNLVNNSARTDGGAIWMDSGTVINCNFTNNSANEDGGAIRISSGTVINCNFTNNTADEWGGAIRISSGTVINCNFTNNRATNDGGAIWISLATVRDCNFIGNNATNRGGAVYFNQTGAVENCDFTCNTARYGAVYFVLTGNVGNCSFTGNNATGISSKGGAVYFASTGNVGNCNFTNNTADYRGGAVYFILQGNVGNCSFTGNNAVDGGALYFFRQGNVTNCSFTDNTAYDWAGAIAMNQGNVTNCNFINNSAYEQGGAIRFRENGTVINCNFINNTVTNGECGAIYSHVDLSTVADTCIFKTGSDKTFQTLVFSPILDVDDFTSTYGSGENLTFDLKTNSGIPIADANISISIYDDNNVWIANYSCLSGEGWTVDFPAGYYHVIFSTEYAQFKPVNKTITVNKANSDLNISNITITLDYGTSTSVTVTTLNATGIVAKINGKNAAVTGNTVMIPVLDAGTYILTVTTVTDSNHNTMTKNAAIFISKLKTDLVADSITVGYNIDKNMTITLKDILGNPLINQVLLVELNGAKTFDLTGSDGSIKVPVKGLPVSTYDVKIIFMGNDNYEGSDAAATLIINKDSTILSADSITTTYNVNKGLVISLKDSRGNPVGGALISVDLGGVKTFTTDSKGKVRISAGRLTPKTYTAKVTFDGNANYVGSSKSVTVTVKKATPKLTAKAKTFKKSAKTKKYTVTLKDNQNKVMKNTKVSIKVNKKVYTAKTNAKGKATFKITKLTKKGKYGAVVTYKGNKYYDKVVMKTKIIVK